MKNMGADTLTASPPSLSEHGAPHGSRPWTLDFGLWTVDWLLSCFRHRLRGNHGMHKLSWVLGILAASLSAGVPADYDLLIRHGSIYDGSGKPPVTGDIAINGQKIAAVGKLNDAHGKKEIDAKGLAVAPGFINMLSWANESLIEDGHS